MATTATALQLQFDASVTSQQRQWIDDAVARARFPFDRASMTIAVKTVPEPPAVGHKDYMCTQLIDGATTIYVRERADDPTAPFNASVRDRLQDFFRECFIHEFAHAFSLNFMATSDADKATICSWFRRGVEGPASPGSGPSRFRAGELADWDPLDRPWADRVQEGLAEFFKDVYLPENFRVFENRSNWQMQREAFGAFMDTIEAVTCRFEDEGTT